MSDLSSIRFFSTQPHECGYIAGKQATTVFVDPDLEIDQPLYSQLSSLGFRRSGQHLYRPHCEACRACIPTRLPVASFTPNRQQKRCIKRNLDLDVKFTSKLNLERHYPLYERYISLRHYDGDMYPPTTEQFESFLSSQWGNAQCLEVTLNDTLVGVAVTDQLNDALSAVYTFFDPDYDKRSLGVFSLLMQIQAAQSRELKYLYLGYWIESCQKMRYKTDYRPIQLLDSGHWQEIE